MIVTKTQLCLCLTLCGLHLLRTVNADVEIPACDFTKLTNGLAFYASPRVRYYFNSSADESPNLLAVGADPADPFPAQVVALLLRHVFRYENVKIYEPAQCQHWPYRCPVRLDLPHSSGYPFAHLGFVYRDAQLYCYSPQSRSVNVSSTAALVTMSRNCISVRNLSELASLSPDGGVHSYMHVAPKHFTKLRLILHSLARRDPDLADYLRWLPMPDIARYHDNKYNACSWLIEQLPKLPPRLAARPSQLRIGLIWPRGFLFDDPQVLEFANVSVQIINSYNCSAGPDRPEFCSLLVDNYRLQLLPRGLDCSNRAVLDFYMRLHCSDVGCRRGSGYGYAGEVEEADPYNNSNGYSAAPYDPLVGLIAGTCSKTVESVAQASTRLGTMIVASTVESPVFARQDIYPNFYRTIPSYVAYAGAVSQFLVANNWYQLGLLTNKKLFLDSQHFTDQMMRVCHNEFLAERDLTLHQAIDSLRRAKEGSCQLFAMDYFRRGTCLYMCAAYQLGMFPRNNYQFILAHWVKDIFTERGANCSGTGIHVPGGCTDSQVTEASNGHLVIKGFLPADRLKSYKSRLGHTASSAAESGSSPGASFTENYFGPYTSDAVYLLANALGRLHSNDSAALHHLKSGRVVREYRRILAATEFDGFRFGDSHEPGSGFLAIWLRGLQRRSAGLGGSNYTYVSKNLATYRWSINKSKLLVSVESGPLLPPKDYWTEDGAFIRLLHPACNTAFMRALNPNWSCNETLTAFLLCLLLAVLTVTACLFIGALHYYRIRVRDRLNQPFREMRDRLAHMEVSKLSIIINRMVGEGCFGTVFGGEIKLSDKRWESCAVKVLTENSKPEAVLKFMEEAEVLCKLNHANIIQLLGVCTMDQPYFIVMEFCLHGDLKSFLMARRTHRGDVTTSPEYLTRYAIDIASGLEYLHSQDPPVLHRDVALRNCLINGSHIVKLGDFGLARTAPNYYRMHSPNFVPVRWMPPEAIQYAYFSVKSDVWAFAVLLYEMITFGKFPFYDWSHQRVMAEVARGFTLLSNFPEAACPRLRDLVTRCWRYAPEDRPLVSELLHELRDQPPCVAACLDDAPPTQPVLGRDRATVAAIAGIGGTGGGSIGGGVAEGNLGASDTWAAVRSLSNVKLNALSLTSVPQWLRSSVQRHRSASDLRAVRIDFQRRAAAAAAAASVESEADSAPNVNVGEADGAGGSGGRVVGAALISPAPAPVLNDPESQCLLATTRV